MLGRLIGKGGDGSIYELIDDKEAHVVKYVQPKIDGIENFLEYFILLHLDHPHLMKAKGVELNEHGLVKILQVRAVGDLGQTRVSNKKKIFGQLIDGVSYLSSKNIIHGDIKPSNVLVLHKGLVKLNDFSLSRFTVSKSTRVMYTNRYRAPEVIIGKASLKSDIYALGCTMYELYFNAVYDRWNFNFPVAISSKQAVFLDLIRNMTLVDPDERYSIDDVKHHPFFGGTKFASYPPVDIDVIESLRTNWRWGDTDVFMAKCMNEEIPLSSQYSTVDRKTCDALRFKLLDNL